MRFLIGALGQEDRAVFRPTQVLAQREAPLDDLAFPLFPGFWHEAPPPDKWAEWSPLYPRNGKGCCCSKGQVVLTLTRGRALEARIRETRSFDIPMLCRAMKLDLLNKGNKNGEKRKAFFACSGQAGGKFVLLQDRRGARHRSAAIGGEVHNVGLIDQEAPLTCSTNAYWNGRRLYGAESGTGAAFVGGSYGNRVGANIGKRVSTLRKGGGSSAGRDTRQDVVKESGSVHSAVDRRASRRNPQRV